MQLPSFRLSNVHTNSQIFSCFQAMSLHHTPKRSDKAFENEFCGNFNFFLSEKNTFYHTPLPTGFIQKLGWCLVLLWRFKPRKFNFTLYASGSCNARGHEVADMKSLEKSWFYVMMTSRLVHENNAMCKRSLSYHDLLLSVYWLCVLYIPTKQTVSHPSTE